MQSTISRRVPPLKAGLDGILNLRTFENRIIGLVFCMCFLVSSMAFGNDKDPAASKALQILQMGFANQSESIQKKLLRDMALLDSDEAIPFFASVALNPAYQEETRREALKGMLAIDSTKYRMALEMLQTSPLQEDLLFKNMQMIEGVNLLPTFLSSLTFQEENRIINMKLSAILKYWNDEEINRFDFSLWPREKASDAIQKFIHSTNRVGYKIHLIELWSKVRTEKSTKEMVKLLDDPSPKVAEAMVLALAEDGSSVAALGRFLQKSKDATLRKRAIYALRKINTQSSKVALKSYEPRATKEEKVWIKEILAQ